MKTQLRVTSAIASLFLVCIALMLMFSSRALASDTPSTAVTAALPRLADYGASRCIPCKLMVPVLEDLKKEFAGRMKVEFIDVFQNPEIGIKYSIEILPTQIFFDATGKELFRHEGYFSKRQILAKWKELGVQFGEKKETR